jgi:DNA-binding transcriptional MocR family regulator
MNTALQRIAVPAANLSAAELRILIELSATTEAQATDTTTVSQRDLAERCKLNRKHVKAALASLNSRGLIESTPATRTHAAAHRIKSKPEVPPIGGPFKHPPPVEMPPENPQRWAQKGTSVDALSTTPRT